MNIGAYFKPLPPILIGRLFVFNRAGKDPWTKWVHRLEKIEKNRLKDKNCWCTWDQKLSGHDERCAFAIQT